MTFHLASPCSSIAIPPPPLHPFFLSPPLPFHSHCSHDNTTSRVILPWQRRVCPRSRSSFRVFLHALLLLLLLLRLSLRRRETPMRLRGMPTSLARTRIRSLVTTNRRVVVVAHHLLLLMMTVPTFIIAIITTTTIATIIFPTMVNFSISAVYSVLFLIISPPLSLLSLSLSLFVTFRCLLVRFRGFLHSILRSYRRLLLLIPILIPILLLLLLLRSCHSHLLRKHEHVQCFLQNLDPAQQTTFRCGSGTCRGHRLSGRLHSGSEFLQILHRYPPLQGVDPLNQSLGPRGAGGGR
mmetsp:Transcript_24859/g.44886  ORF Transcript_24859/g.44886 Transcript_24859/m.44886 type:complete len:295 (-) Transcript_24859:1663-2547(-)